MAGATTCSLASRNPEAWGGLARPVSIRDVDAGAGADFLASRLPGAERRALLALADTLGGLPLALEQAASFMEETGMTVEAYRPEAEGIDTARLILDEGRAATGYERSALATLSIAFGACARRRRNCCGLCAFFSAEPIPERFFREQADSLAEPLAAAARDTLTWEKTVGQLRRFGLADRIAIPALDRPADSTDACTEQARRCIGLPRRSHATRYARSRTIASPSRPCCGVPFRPKRAAGLLAAFASLLPHVRDLDRYRPAGWLDIRRQVWMLAGLGCY